MLNLKTFTQFPELDDVISLPVIDSTNLEAHRLNKQHRNENILVIADAQTAGKGRGNNHWESSPGLGLWMSLLIGRPEQLAHNLRLVSLYTGLIIHRVLAKQLTANLKLKWPNDIMIGDAKCAGILTELQWSGTVVTSAIIGVGLNLTHSLSDFGPAIKSTATSLQLASWPNPDAQQLVTAIVMKFFSNMALLDSSSELALQWNHRAYQIGQQVTWQAGDEQYRGRFLGVNASGAAQIEINGVLESRHAGEIHFNR